MLGQHYLHFPSQFIRMVLVKAGHVTLFPKILSIKLQQKTTQQHTPPPQQSQAIG